MKKSALKARIRVLESDLEVARRWSDDRRTCLVRAEGALREIGEVLSTISATAVETDKRAVGGWFARLIITTPTLILLADQAKTTLEANREALRQFDQWTASR